jgi:hypothetical protein
MSSTTSIWATEEKFMVTIGRVICIQSAWRTTNMFSLSPIIVKMILPFHIRSVEVIYRRSYILWQANAQVMKI